jgi:hypothetical protein
MLAYSGRLPGKPEDGSVFGDQGFQGHSTSVVAPDGLGCCCRTDIGASTRATQIHPDMTLYDVTLTSEANFAVVQTTGH